MHALSEWDRLQPGRRQLPHRETDAGPGLFPAEAGPTNTRDPAECTRSVSGTGFSREGVEWHTAELTALTLASSRLKPVPQIHAIPLNTCGQSVGPALAGKASAATP